MAKTRRRMAQIKIDANMLLDQLMLPNHINLIGCSFNAHTQEVVLFVESPFAPEMRGGIPREIIPVYIATEDETWLKEIKGLDT